MKRTILAAFALAIASIATTSAFAAPSLNTPSGQMQFWQDQADRGNGGK